MQCRFGPLRTGVTMATELESLVKDALSGLIAPGDSIDIIKNKRLSALIVDDGNVAAVLEFGEKAPSEVEKFRAEVESVIRAIDGVKSAAVVSTGAKGSRPKEAPKPMAGQNTAPTPIDIPGVKHIIAVSSGKGGVGKSTTSINLALALRDMGLKVGIMDADVFGPSLPTLVGKNEKPTLKDDKIMPIEALGLKAMSIGFLIDVDQPVAWRGPRVMGAIGQLLHEVAWGPLDVLVVDMPPGTGDVQLTMVQKAPLSGAVVVSTPQDLALIDARKGITMFEKVNVPILGIIENMSQFICPNCGTTSHIFGTGGARAEAEKLGTPFLGEIPLAMSIRKNADNGTPTVEADKDSPEAKPYQAIAQQIREKLSL